MLLPERTKEKQEIEDDDDVDDDEGIEQKNVTYVVFTVVVVVVVFLPNRTLLFLFMIQIRYFCGGEESEKNKSKKFYINIKYINRKERQALNRKQSRA